jgi:hypothetical protein
VRKVLERHAEEALLHHVGQCPCVGIQHQQNALWYLHG